MNKKTYLLFVILPCILCLCHLGHLLPKDEILLEILSDFISRNFSLFMFISGIYYFALNYVFFKNTFWRVAVFSLSGLALWWGIENTLYFTIGKVDNIGKGLSVFLVIYNFAVMLLALGITYLVRKIKNKKRKTESIEMVEE